MDWGKVAKTVLGAGAPILGGVLGGPLGAAAGAMVGKAFGLSEAEAADPANVLKSLTLDPAAAVKLREIESNERIELERLAVESMRITAQTDLESDKAFLADRQGARVRQVDSERATGRRDYNLYILAWTIVVGFFGLCWALMVYPLPEGQNEAVFLLFGGLISGFTGVVQYFFGSSKGSYDKTALIAKQQGHG